MPEEIDKKLAELESAVNDFTKNGTAENAADHHATLAKLSTNLIAEFDKAIKELVKK